MRFTALTIKDAYLIDLKVFQDNRGSFARTFCKNEFNEVGLEDFEFVQINHSITSQKGTIRGLHYQAIPHTEDKLIRCIHGAVYDVIVDLRPDSDTYLKWEAVELSQNNKQMVLIPKGCAHGFQTLTKDAELLYHHTAYYEPKSDRGIHYKDPILNIDWPSKATVISDKDNTYPFISQQFEGIKL